MVGATPFSLAANGLADQTQVMITDTNQSALLGWGTVTNGEMTLEFSGAAAGTKIDFVFAPPQGEGELIPLSGTVQNDGTIKVNSGGREVALSTWLASKNVLLAQTLADKLQPEANDDNKLERVPEAEAPLVTPSTPDIGGESGVESALPRTAPPPQSQTQPKADQGAKPSKTSPNAALPPPGEGVPPAPGTPVPESAAGTEPGLNDGNAAGGSTEDPAGQNTSPGTANPETGPGTTDPDTANPGTTGPGTTDPGAPPAEPGESTQPAPQDGSQNGGVADNDDSGNNGGGSSGGDDSSGDNGGGSGEDAGETPPAAPDDGSAVDDPGDNGGANDDVSDPGGAQSGADEPSPGEPSADEPGTEPEAGPADPGSPPGEPDTPDGAPDNSDGDEVSPPDNSAAGDTGLAEPTPDPAPEPTPPTAAPGGDDGSGVSEGEGSVADGGADGSQPGDDGAADTGTTGEETPLAPSGP